MTKEEARKQLYDLVAAPLSGPVDHLPLVKPKVGEIIESVSIDYLKSLKAPIKDSIYLYFKKDNDEGKDLTVIVSKQSFMIDSFEYKIPYSSWSKDTLNKIKKGIEWMDTYTVVDRIRECSRLNNNWDGYGAIPPAKGVKENCFKFLRQLPLEINQPDPDNVCPTPYGSIVMDFYNDLGLISVELGTNELGYFTDFMGCKNYAVEGFKWEEYPEAMEELYCLLKGIKP